MTLPGRFTLEEIKLAIRRLGQQDSALRFLEGDNTIGYGSRGGEFTVAEFQMHNNCNSRNMYSGLKIKHD